MKKILYLGLTAVLLLALVGCQQNQADIATMPADGYVNSGQTAADATVEIINNRFLPEQLEIKVGDTLEWINRDNVDHTITALGVTQKIPAGESYAYTFDQSGTYQYSSTEYPDMVGTIMVKEMTETQISETSSETETMQNGGSGSSSY